MSEEQSLISVIIPAYNIAPYISRCLDSVLQQSYQNIEVIVIDDGSSDKTGQIVEEYVKQDGRVLLVQKANAGVTQARLDGLRIAKGEYVSFIDGDDWIEPDMLEVLLKNAKDFHGQISHCGYQMNFSTGETRYFYNTGRTVVQDRIQGVKDLLEGAFVEPGLCNKLYEKSLFEPMLQGKMPLDSSIRINEDLLWNFCLFCESTNAVFYDVCPYHYMIRGDSASRQKLNEHRIYDPIRVKRLILEHIPQELLPVAQAAYIGTCLDIYNSIVAERDGDFHGHKRAVRSFIKQDRQLLAMLGTRRRWCGKLLLAWPWLYERVYRIYERWFQKKKYG